VDRLAGVHPELAHKVRLILEAMKTLGFPMMVTGGVRTTAEQQALYALGRSKPGKVVTYRDGVRLKSNHQTKADGFGHAVDCAFLADVDGDGSPDDPSWDMKHPWELYGAMAKALGLVWGGSWKMRDLPHVELPE
jgi:peptidoglycan LD-endopeptidase CwlK